MGRGFTGLVGLLAATQAADGHRADGGRLVQARAAGLPGPLGGDARVAGPPPARHARHCGPATHDRVALMFLTRGAVLQEPVYAAWFADAAMLRPIEALAEQGCDEVDISHWWHVCAPSPAAVRADPIAAQDLFSVYVHPAPDFGGLPATSIFRHSLLPPAQRVATEWGEHSLVVAHKRLLRAALAEPRNQQFVLLSDSDVPLYPSSVVYEQLVAEPHSRINACVEGIHDAFRYHPGMHAMAGIAPSSWRKSGQFAGLRRAHAELLVAERRVEGAFARLCTSRAHDAHLGRSFVCYGDEHYMATALAHLGRGPETDCAGRAMRVIWPEEPSSHPLTFGAADVSAELVARLRGGDACRADAASAAARAEARVLQVGLPPQRLRERCLTLAPFDPAPLRGNCSLFGRKFDASATAGLVSLFGGCGPDGAAAIAGCRSGRAG